MRRTRFSIGSLMGFVLIVALGIGGLKNASPLWASACYSLAFAGLVAGVLFAVQSRARKRAFWVGFSVSGWTYFVMVFILSAASSSSIEAPPFLTSVLFEEGQALFFPDNNPALATTLMPIPVPPPPPAPLLIAAPTAPQPTPTTGAVRVPVLAPVPVMAASPAPVPLMTSAPAPVPTLIPIGSGISPTYIMNANGTVTTASFAFPAGTVVAAPTFLASGNPEMCFEQIGQSIATMLFAYFCGLFSLFLTVRRERNEANPSPEVSPSSP